jgi:hypothetical protein
MPQLLTNHLIRLGHLASLVSSMTPMFDELDLFPSPRIEDDVKTSPIWHSPLYCPSGTYVGAKTPRNSTEALTAELCRNVQSWLGTFEGVGDESGEESMLPYRQHCRQAIALFRPYAGSSTSESGYVYECCRLVAHLMLRAEALHCSLKKAAQGTTCPVEINNALQKTNLFDLWGSQIGLLYWVLLVSCTSVSGSSFNLNPTTVLLNFLIGKIGTSDYHVEVGLRPLQKLKWFNETCHSKV